MEPHMDPCKKTNYLEPWNVLDPFLQCMLYYIHSQHYIDKMDLEHVWNDQLSQLDKTQYMILYLCKYLDNPTICNQRTPLIGSKS